MDNIDLFVISGFLGSGKTTFLQKALNNFSDKKIAVLVNEFGGYGIDGKVLDSNGIELVEINNGSIFCACLKGKFVETLIELSKQDIDLLLIENSGMADPSNMGILLEELKDKVGRTYNYKGAICLIDSNSFLKHLKILTPIQNQVASSNLIIINKIDLVNEDVLKEIQLKIKEINPNAHIYKTMFGDIPMDIISGKLKFNGYIGETSNKPWNRPLTYSLECKDIVKISSFKEFIRNIQEFTFRIKGFAETDEGWYKVDCVGDSFLIEKTILKKRNIITHTKIVLIGKDKTPFEEEMKKAWENSNLKNMDIFS